MMKSIGSALKIATAAIALQVSAPSASFAQSDDYTYYVTNLTSLANGFASASLVWNADVDSQLQDRQLQAFLLAKLNGGSDDISARESVDFRTINNIDYSITSTPTQIIFSLQAPQEAFHDAVEHAAAIFASGEVDENWLKRTMRTYRPVNSTRVRRPANVVAELYDYINYTSDAEPLSLDQLKTEILRQPNQVILNAREFDFGDAAEVLSDAFEAKSSALNGVEGDVPRNLPKGTIFVEDPNATETLVFIINDETYESYERLAQADTLYKYMGYGPGSEMFRIIRQEYRAAYSPESHFELTADKAALAGLSATVPAEDWETIYNVIAQIYRDARAGKNSKQGLKDSKDSMLNSIMFGLRREPDWLIKRFLEAYPDGPPSGSIQLPLLGAAFNLVEDELNDSASEALTPLEDMLSIVIGGKAMPSDAMRQNGYCELNSDDALSVCLDKLAE